MNDLKYFIDNNEEIILKFGINFRSSKFLFYEMYTIPNLIFFNLSIYKKSFTLFPCNTIEQIIKKKMSNKNNQITIYLLDFYNINHYI